MSYLLKQDHSTKRSKLGKLEVELNPDSQDWSLSYLIWLFFFLLTYKIVLYDTLYLLLVQILYRIL